MEDQTELICRFLPDGTINFVNKAFCRYCGRKWNELVGRSLLQFHTKAHRAQVKDLLSTLSVESSATIHEHAFHPSEGKTVWQKWTLQALTDSKSGSRVFQAVGQDVTELKQMAEALKKANDELEGLVAKRTGELQVSNEELREMNRALQTLVRNIDKDKKEELEGLSRTIRKKILPNLEDIRKRTGSSELKAKLDVVTSHMYGIASKPTQKTKLMDYLTPTELEIGAMIASGLTTNEIARELKVTYETVKSHRRNIRKKLNIQNKNINLTSYLKPRLKGA